MAHLGFGGRLIHGAVDARNHPDAVSPAAANNAAARFAGCDGAEGSPSETAATIEHALGSPDSLTHGGLLDSFWCGDSLRKAVVRVIQDERDKSLGLLDEPTTHGQGYPDFIAWPRWNDLLHQKMWVDWMRRAHERGELNVIVGLAVHSETLARLLGGTAPLDDRASADLQLQAMKDLARAHEWIEIALSPRQLREIVRRGHLALVLGMEVDDLGGFLDQEDTTPRAVTAEVQRLFDLGVRYVLPVHSIDNLFGATAVYEPYFETSNVIENGRFLELACSDPAMGIDLVYRRPNLSAPERFLLYVRYCELFGECEYEQPPWVAPLACAAGTGHVNARGLTPLGEHLLRKLMERGMMIDIDHMSARSIDDAFRVAQSFGGRGVGYPLSAGHNGLRSASTPTDPNAPASPATERNLSPRQIRSIVDSGGIFGVGSAGLSPTQFIAAYSRFAEHVGIGRGLALGTDTNGLEPSPRPPCSAGDERCVALRYPDFYAQDFPPSQTGNRTWHYPSDGVAHYGLFADFLRDLGSRKDAATTGAALSGADVVERLRLSAEHFAQTWERSQDVARCHASGTCKPRVCAGGASAGTTCSTDRNCLDRSPSHPARWIVGRCRASAPAKYPAIDEPQNVDPAPL